jgi:hypothetical protein
VDLNAVPVELHLMHPAVGGRHSRNDRTTGRDEAERTGHFDGRSTLSNRMRPHFTHGGGAVMGSSAFVKSPQLEHIHARLSSRSARVTALSGKPMRLVICFLVMPEM